MAEENISQKFRLKNILNKKLFNWRKTDWTSKKHEKFCMATVAFAVTGCVSFSAFASLDGVQMGIAGSVAGLKICAIARGIKKYKSIIKKKKKKHDKTVLLAKTKLNSMEVLVSKALIGSYISHDEFLSLYNVSREYDNMKEAIKV